MVSYSPFSATVVIYGDCYVRYSNDADSTSTASTAVTVKVHRSALSSHADCVSNCGTGCPVAYYSEYDHGFGYEEPKQEKYKYKLAAMLADCPKKRTYKKPETIKPVPQPIPHFMFGRQGARTC